jgi:hypothetical protein
VDRRFDEALEDSLRSPPYFSNGRHGDAGNYDGLVGMPIANGSAVKTALDADVCGKADLYLCGHDHNRQWLTERCGGTTELGFLYVDADTHTLR